MSAAGAGARPAGYAATATAFLDEAATGGNGRNLAMRQLAALQGIGWALLALGEELADAIDASADCATQLAGIADAISDVAAGEPSAANPLVRTACSSSGKSTAIRRYLADFFRRHPGAEVRVIDLKAAPGIADETGRPDDHPRHHDRDRRRQAHQLHR